MSTYRLSYRSTSLGQRVLELVDGTRADALKKARDLVRFQDADGVTDVEVRTAEGELVDVVKPPTARGADQAVAHAISGALLRYVDRERAYRLEPSGPLVLDDPDALDRLGVALVEAATHLRHEQARARAQANTAQLVEQGYTR